MDKCIICDGLSLNKFKGVWSARVTVLASDGHILHGYSFEGDTKGGVKKEAEDFAFDLGLEYLCDVWYKMD